MRPDMKKGYLLVDDALQIFLRRGADDREDQIKLIQVVLAGEKRTVVKHLTQDAADRPYVDRLRVALRVEHDLRRAVPSEKEEFLRIGEYSSVAIYFCLFQSYLVATYSVKKPV